MSDLRCEECKQQSAPGPFTLMPESKHWCTHSSVQEIVSLESRLQVAVEGLESPELLERLAEIEHGRWSRWHQYMRDKMDDYHMERWDELSKTDYGDLSEHSKESDRKEARETLEAIKNFTLEKIKSAGDKKL